MCLETITKHSFNLVEQKSINYLNSPQLKNLTLTHLNCQWNPRILGTMFSLPGLSSWPLFSLSLSLLSHLLLSFLSNSPGQLSWWELTNKGERHRTLTIPIIAPYTGPQRERKERIRTMTSIEKFKPSFSHTEHRQWRHQQYQHALSIHSPFPPPESLFSLWLRVCLHFCNIPGARFIISRLPTSQFTSWDH